MMKSGYVSVRLCNNSFSLTRKCSSPLSAKISLMLFFSANTTCSSRSKKGSFSFSLNKRPQCVLPEPMNPIRYIFMIWLDNWMLDTRYWFLDTGCWRLLKRIYSRHIHTGNKQVNVMCAFICDHTLEIHHVPHNGILPRNAHSSQHLPGIAACISGHFTGVTLGHTDLLW